ncbi:MAG: undecaprenyl-diphosphate phosphatase [Oscillospiraceae bacterium]|nr:undecaprenyl-diphosphate phosphatase [Oscillospiraceae bacterium]
MSIFDAIIQAVIQGLTEFLPVSSSGHLKLYQSITGQSVEEGTFLLVILHLGTLVAVCIAFWDTIWALIKEFFATVKDVFTGKFKWSQMNPDRRMLVMLFISLVLLVPFYLIKDVFENISLPILGICFLFTSAELFFASRIRNSKKTAGDITVKDAVVIGLFQCAALFPGVSRSGSTISGGLFSGLEKETAVRYSFVLGIPAILGGCLVEMKDLLEGTIEVNVGSAAIGFVAAVIVGILAIKLVQWLIRSDNFIVFSIYTLLVGIGTLIYWFVAARG